jgi:hypothetical protein
VSNLIVLILAVGTLGLVGLIYGGSYVLSSLSDCSGKERAIVEHYPHYGDRQIATYPWTFSCSVRYTTKASRKEVLVYYDDVLAQNGWETMGYQTYLPNQGLREGPARGKRLSDLWELPRSAGGTLVASRNGYGYCLRASEQGGPGPPRREGPSDGFCQRPSATSTQLPQIAGI